MTEQDAINAALAHAAATGVNWLAVKRTDHPLIHGDYCYAIAEDDKRRWTAGESVIILAAGLQKATKSGTLD